MSGDDVARPPSTGTGQPGSDMADELRLMWQRLDPVPVGLTDRVLFALQLEQLTAADLDLELLRLTDEQVGAGAGARGGDDVRTVTFTGAHLTVMLAVGATPEGRRVDGWVAPGGARLLEVRTSAGVAQHRCDATGRFTLPDVPAGHLQLVLSRLDDDDSPAFVTPALTL